MQPLAFILSGLLAIVGVLLLALGALWAALLPLIARMAFMLARGGSFSAEDYVPDLGSYDTISWGCIIIGLGLCLALYHRRTPATPRAEKILVKE